MIQDLTKLPVYFPWIVLLNEVDEVVVGFNLIVLLLTWHWNWIESGSSSIPFLYLSIHWMTLAWYLELSSLGSIRNVLLIISSAGRTYLKVGISIHRGSSEKSKGVSVITEFPGCCSCMWGAVSRSSALFSAMVVTCD